MNRAPCSVNLSHPLDRQRGAALFITLIFLIILTMLVLSSMRTNIIEERMAGNARDRNTALQSAEAVLRDAERDILSGRIVGTTGFTSGCSSTGLCLPETDGTPVWVDLANANNTGWMTGVDAVPSVKYGTYSNPNPTTISSVAAQPRYIIEALNIPKAGSLKVGFGVQQQDYLYRVTAVGFGASVNTRVVIQAIFRQ